MVELGEKGSNVVKNGFSWWKTRECGEAFLGRSNACVPVSCLDTVTRIHLHSAPSCRIGGETT